MANTQVSASAPDVAPARSRKEKPRRQNLAGWMFVGPVIFGVLAFQIVPVIASLGVSMTNWTGLNEPDFLGLGNFVALFTTDTRFYSTLLNTAIFTVAMVVLSIAIGLALAVLCNQRIRGVGVFRTLYYSPAITNVVAIGFVWFWLYEPNNGLINSTLRGVGITGPAWLSDPSTALIAVIIVALWQGVGYPMVILLAGLQSIDKSLLEAATVDGASNWLRFWRVTFPLLTPSIFFLTIMQFISSFQVFGIIYVMTSGGPNNATSVLIFEIYQVAFAQGRLGYASAMGWVLFLIVGLVTVFQWKMEKRWVHYDS
ncbi:carbohydrate ABC transporter permease [Occultella aeris]|uniref:Lactose transport system permease protein LacF n=1 Tax=Occultella aeris TaxID=2761496 RepID=A0A7M4DGT9_9MICO|nr:sugar ABC transporter permease [Occultella aeris]VZO36132.1 Lactose transport system permease protein LacF [Occultella aeris]